MRTRSTKKKKNEDGDSHGHWIHINVGTTFMVISKKYGANNLCCLDVPMAFVWRELNFFFSILENDSFGDATTYNYQIIKF